VTFSLVLELTDMIDLKIIEKELQRWRKMNMRIIRIG